MGEGMEKFVKQMFQINPVGVAALPAVVAEMACEQASAVFTWNGMLTHLDDMSFKIGFKQI